MTKRLATIVFTALAVVVVLLLVWWRSHAPTPVPVESARTEPGEAPVPVLAGESVEGQLFFPNQDGLLVPETRTIPAPDADRAADSGRDLAEASLLAWFEGPRTSGLFAVFPADVSLDRVELGTGGVLYVGLKGPETPPPAGSLEETLRIWSIVHTALSAAPEARSVVLLWNGAQRESLGGHVDTARPLALRADLLAPAP